MKRRFCFTLVEILVVTALVALLGAIGFAGYGYAMGAARRSATESLIKQIEAALENFKIKKGYYPASSSYAAISIDLSGTDPAVSFGGTALGTDASKVFIKPLDQEKLKKSISGTTLVDSWGGTIYYRYPGLVNAAGFDLIAPGPDSEFGTKDYKGSTPLTGNVKDKGVESSSEETVKNNYLYNREWACDDIANFMNK